MYSKSNKQFILNLLFIPLFFGYFNAGAQNDFIGSLSDFKDFPRGAVYQNVRLTPEERARDVVKQLTLPEILTLTGGYNLFFFPGVPRLGLKPVYMSDASQGIRLGKFPPENAVSSSFPAMQALAATWNPGLAQLMGESIGEECRSLGVDILLGPSINLQRTSVCGRNFEYPGEDPVLTEQIITAYIKGVQDNQVVATAKAFIANSQEFCRHFASSDIDERTLRELYLRPWEAAIHKGKVKAIMTGNHAINGVPCSMDQQLMRDVLRDEYGFTGMIMTDWQSTNYFPDLQYLFPSSGVSLLMANNNTFRNYLGGYLAQYPKRKDEIYQALRKKVYQNLLSLFEMGVYDRPAKDIRQFHPVTDHKANNRRIAEEAICLLKNEGNLLPLSGKGPILLMGDPEPGSGRGSGAVKGYDHVSFEDGFRELYGKRLEVAEKPDEKKIKNAGVIVYRLNKTSGEGIDIPFEEGLDLNIEKIATLNPNVIVLISAGNSMPMPWLKKVKAVLWCFYLGQERGHALAGVLSGKINPSGKLPFTIEKDFKDAPDPEFNYIGGKPYWFGDNSNYKQYWLTGKPTADKQFMENVKPHEMLRVPYSEGVFMGYRWYDKRKKEVLFPFGYGLSYTRFEYSNLSLSSPSISGKDSLSVRLTVSNTGKRAGMETVQLYISDRESSVDRPVKELKRFEKLQLAPGTSQSVTFTIGADDLAFWDEKKHGWKTEPGTFEVMVGASSRDIRLQKSFVFQ